MRVIQLGGVNEMLPGNIEARNVLWELDVSKNRPSSGVWHGKCDVGVELETGWGTCVGEMITSEVNTESADANYIWTVTLRSHVGHDGL